MKSVVTTERVPIKMWLGEDEIEPGALAQAKNAANLPGVFKWISIMPDSHQGYGVPIGSVIALQGLISPNLVGVDIGCGMSAAKTSLTVNDLDEEVIKRWMQGVRGRIPLGFKHQKDRQEWEGFRRAPDAPIVQQELNKAHYQLGTLGGGNHFIELQKDEFGDVWIMLHSGSRNIGLKIANFYHGAAQALCERWHSDVPHKDLAFLPLGDLQGDDYMQAMNWALDFAYANRAHMMDVCLDVLDIVSGGANLEHEVNIHHNYAAMEHHFGKDVLVHRKGATLAREGTIGIIPGSMGTQSYIVEGLGNRESFNSCSHGAGRKMGRNQAKKNLNLEEQQEIMKDVIGGPRSQKDLDEAPGAYKDIDTVMANQEDLVVTRVTLTPLASIKG